MTRQEELELKIREYDINYRNGNPLCSDKYYDDLMDELKKNYPNSKILQVGVLKQDQKEDRKQKLPIPMYSLDKLKSVSEIKKWLKSKKISNDELLVITPKFDGISIVVNENTKKCWTRGDGEFGQTSNEHLNVMNIGEKKFLYFETVHTYGEAIMNKSNFEKYDIDYANARNMVASLFNSDKITNKLNDVDYIRYGCDIEDINKNDQLEFLNKLNGVKVLYNVVSVNDINEKLLDSLYETYGREYQIDGLVIEINSSEIREKLGRERNMNPSYARAFKNPKWSSVVSSIVRDITWQVSKQGKMKPIINIEPVVIGGVTVSNVTGNNAKYIFNNNICKDSVINITRSGDVIPKHLETISYDSNNLSLLEIKMKNCPHCNSLLSWDETNTELICNNSECGEKKISKLVHFFTSMDVKEFGQPSIEKFYNNGYNTIEKILTMNVSNIYNIEGFGDKSSSKLVTQFSNILSKNVSFSQLVYALDLFEGKIGEKIVQNIINTLTDDEIFNISTYDTNFINKLTNIEGVAFISAEAFVKGMIIYNQKYFDFFNIKSINFNNKIQMTGDKLKNEKICFTGCRPSKEMEIEIQNQGGTIVSGVSGKTTLLIVKDLSSKTLSSTKAKKADELNIKIIEFDNLKELLN